MHTLARFYLKHINKFLKFSAEVHELGSWFPSAPRVENMFTASEGS